MSASLSEAVVGGGEECSYLFIMGVHLGRGDVLGSDLTWTSRTAWRTNSETPFD